MRLIRTPALWLFAVAAAPLIAIASDSIRADRPGSHLQKCEDAVRLLFLNYDVTQQEARAYGNGEAHTIAGTFELRRDGRTMGVVHWSCELTKDAGERIQVKRTYQTTKLQGARKDHPY